MEVRLLSFLRIFHHYHADRQAPLPTLLMTPRLLVMYAAIGAMMMITGVQSHSWIELVIGAGMMGIPAFINGIDQAKWQKKLAFIRSMRKLEKELNLPPWGFGSTYREEEHLARALGENKKDDQDGAWDGQVAVVHYIEDQDSYDIDWNALSTGMDEKERKWNALRRAYNQKMDERYMRGVATRGMMSGSDEEY